MDVLLDQSNAHLGSLSEALAQFWGYNSFLPLQREAMECVLDGRDSLVVLPTGGGKSLCYQAPAVCGEGMTVVVSPLISLMKDQVDALTACGVPAACVNSSLSDDEKRIIADDVRAGRLRLLYMAPERLVSSRTLNFLQTANVTAFAVDEAHCISEWGHDFRPEYGQLRVLRESFPDVSLHAYTATATERVRSDIIEKLGLDEPEVLVGSFDRPNLHYRVAQKNNVLAQIRAVIDRHPGDSGIIYCISRAEVERISATLSQMGYKSMPYHAGLPDDERRRHQEAFIEEKTDIMVATVAFGMGIDKSNVRYVLHAGMPKSLESYQQESGRAGRDGLDAECCLFYSGGDFTRWRRMIAESNPSAQEASLQTLQAISDFASGVTCRHRSLVEYFGQPFESENCGACDICLGEFELLDAALIVGQKILSCVVRLQQRMGADYVAMVLSGSNDQRIINSQHNELSTWGILGKHKKKTIRDWIEQLVSQSFLARAGEFGVLEITADGRRLLKGELTPRLLKPTVRAGGSSSQFSADSWEGVDQGLFEALRALRREQADNRELPPYMIFSDATLRDMARRRPSSTERFREVRGVGEKKCKDFGDEYVACIVAFAAAHELPLDVEAKPSAQAVAVEPRGAKLPGAGALAAFDLFREGCSTADVAAKLGRADSTVHGYLSQYIREHRICDPSPWVENATAAQIRTAAAEVGIERLRLIFDHLEGTVGYDQIRAVVECLRNQTEGTPSTSPAKPT